MARDKADRAADELYGLPLAEFTPARDRLARQLRKEGQSTEADAVKALRKPTAAAWALNQLARRRPKDVKRLLAAGRKLRKAQVALLKRRDREALQAASSEEREIVDDLARDATAVAAEAGTASTAALDERIRNTLHAAALDEETAAELAAGRLVREREAVGMFGSTTGTAADSAPAPPGQSRESKRALAAAKAEEQKAAREHARAEKAVERATKAADDAQQRADTARAALRDAEEREQEAAQARDDAARAVAAAEKKLA